LEELGIDVVDWTMIYSVYAHMSFMSRF
jgi:hypothetical protein